jgi:hypothetical protein
MWGVVGGDEFRVQVRACREKVEQTLGYVEVLEALM